MKHVIAIIDRSGSMATIANDMNGGIKEWFKELKKTDPDTLVTSVLFDTEYDVTNDRVPAKNVKYKSLLIEPRGMTALNDAIFKGVANIKDGEDALLLIVTDGGENSSKEVTDKKKVKNRLAKLQKQGVEIVYLSANVDAFSDSAAYGISAASTFTYAPTAAGTQSVSSTLRSYTVTYQTKNSNKTNTSKTPVSP